MAVADRSRIEWTEATWNPVTGCDQVSPGLRALLRQDVRRALARRRRAPLRAGLRPAAVAGRLEQPLRWKKPRTIFVNSMSDLFHEEIPCRFHSSRSSR